MKTLANVYSTPCLVISAGFFMESRDFKGVWIPRNVWLSNELTLQEKVILVEIDSLDNKDGCFASNEYFSEFFGLSVRQIQRCISSLEKSGYIESFVDKSKGNKRTIRVTTKMSLGSRHKCHEGHDINVMNNNTSNNTSNTVSNRDRTAKPSVARILVRSNRKSAIPADYGKREVNLILSKYEEHIGSKPVDRNPRNVANTFVRQIYKFIAEVKQHRPDLSNFDDVVEKAFGWYDSKMSEVNTYSLDTVRRHVVNTLFGNTLKDLPVKQNKYAKEAIGSED